MKFDEYKKYIIPNTSEELSSIDYAEAASFGLIDLMVPLDIMMLQVPNVEGCNYISPSYNFYSIDDSGKLVLEKTNEIDLLSADYSYSMPICQKYTEIDPQDLTDEIVRDWITKINRRVAPIVKNAISRLTVEKFDNDNAAACFYHIFSGQMDFFKRSPENTIQILKWSPFLFRGIKEHLINSKKWLIDISDPVNCEITYSLNIVNDEKDHIAMFDTIIPEPIATMWETYIFKMFEHNAKVIIVP